MQVPNLARRNEVIRVMLADDHTVFRAAVRMVVDAESDMTVVAEAASGPEVIPALHEHPADVLLLDLDMPSMDGFAVLRMLASSGTAVNTLVLTGIVNTLELSPAMQLGARGIVLKQSGSHDLLRAIRDVYCGNVWVDKAVSAPVEHGGPGREIAVEGSLTPQTPVSHLTRREREVAGLVCEGLQYKEIAERLTISPQTVKNHIRNIFSKLNVRNRVELGIVARHELGAPYSGQYTA